MKFLARFRRRRQRLKDQALSHPVTGRIIVPGGPAWDRADIIDAILLWSRLYGAPPTYTDWSRARAVARQDHRAIERMGEAGDWPTARQVVRRFGSWNAALVASGFQPRPRHRPAALRPAVA